MNTSPHNPEFDPISQTNYEHVCALKALDRSFAIHGLASQQIDSRTDKIR